MSLDIYSSVSFKKETQLAQCVVCNSTKDGFACLAQQAQELKVASPHLEYTTKPDILQRCDALEHAKTSAPSSERLV